MAILERLVPVAEWANDRGPIVANVVGFFLLAFAAALFPRFTWRRLRGRQ